MCAGVLPLWSLAFRLAPLFDNAFKNKICIHFKLNSVFKHEIMYSKLSRVWPGYCCTDHLDLVTRSNLPLPYPPELMFAGLTWPWLWSLGVVLTFCTILTLTLLHSPDPDIALLTCMHASCPLMAAMCAGTQPLGVMTVVSAPCHSNQCKHYNHHNNS